MIAVMTMTMVLEMMPVLRKSRGKMSTAPPIIDVKMERTVVLEELVFSVCIKDIVILLDITAVYYLVDANNI